MKSSGYRRRSKTAPARRRLLRNTGWGKKTRTKVSKWADRGFKYEIRLEVMFLWRETPDPRYLELFENIRRCCGKYRIVSNVEKFSSHYRIYVATEADLLLIRMVANKDIIFRAYELVSKTI